MNDPQRLSVDAARATQLRTLELVELLDQAETLLGKLNAALAKLRALLAKLS